MKEIKIRYIWKRKSDGHIWMEISPIECIEGFGDKPFILTNRTEMWELVSRNLFTGLKDKNGHEIYEGDIVLCADSGECFPEEYNKEKDEYFSVGKYEVVYQGEVNYPAFELKDSPCEDMNGLAYAHANSIEVIGNIYENPELLEKP